MLKYKKIFKKKTRKMKKKKWLIEYAKKKKKKSEKTLPCKVELRRLLFYFYHSGNIYKQ